MHSLKLKRFFDFSVALISLIFFSFPLLILSMLVRLDVGSPLLFKQVRPGLNAKPFTMYKFRTMRDFRDSEGEPLPDERRLTKLGQFLRKTSLDELPELFNVIKGDMSLVGPRPLLAEYLHLYDENQMRRHMVKPGIAGWAQIHGRNSISWEEKFKLDNWYVDNWSFILDLKILGRTFATAFLQKNISHEGYATMPKFEGSQKGKQA